MDNKEALEIIEDIVTTYIEYCAKNKTCYRATATPNSFRQSYSEFHRIWRENGGDKCETFYERKEYDEQ